MSAGKRAPWLSPKTFKMLRQYRDSREKWLAATTVDEASATFDRMALDARRLAFEVLDEALRRKRAARPGGGK